MRKGARRAHIASAAAGHARTGAALGRDDVELWVATEEHATPVGDRGDFDGSERGVVVGEFLVADFLLRHVEVVPLDVDVRGVSRYGFAGDAVLFEVLVCGDWVSYICVCLI